MKLMVMLATLLSAVQLFAAVNLNTATTEELAQLRGIGPVIAERIVKYRSTHTFKDTRDLMNVKGVGKKRYEHIKDDLSL